MRRAFGIRSGSKLPLVRLTLSGALLAPLVTGCLERSPTPQDPHLTATVVEKIGGSSVERIDLLLAIDNSGSMADKQEILARAVPDLVERLVNPRCVDKEGVPAATKTAPGEDCPTGTTREFLAVPDIHIGIVSSTLASTSNGLCQGVVNDNGHLLSRDEDGAKVPTYEKLGFLAWDPGQKLDPPGEAVLSAGDEGLIPHFQQMVRGVGEDGCGFEGQLESWYRFLIDPKPYGTLERDGDALVPTGVDKTILAQRKAFLRPDSLVAVVMLSDENDCSVAPGDHAATLYSLDRMVKPRAICATSPDDVCCTPCGEAAPTCPQDPSCEDENGAISKLSADDDGTGLRCFDQKRRFGRDFLHPVDRYVSGLRDKRIQNSDGELVDNPLYADLDPDDDLKNTRGPDFVFLTGIVGVPWQDIARDPTSLKQGYKTAKEMLIEDAEGHDTWDKVLGEDGKDPLDLHMIESQDPRPGLPGPDASIGADPFSGHERPHQKNELQYACTFSLLAPRDCTKEDSCDCGIKNDAYKNNPLCQAEDGTYSTTQIKAKAFPGRRELSVLEGIGDQAIVASVCPANMDEGDGASPPDDFGYRPAIGALIDRLKEKLGYQCLPRSLSPAPDGQVECLVLEARVSDAPSCDGVNRIDVPSTNAGIIEEAKQSETANPAWNQFCLVPQLSGDDLHACQTTEGDPIVVDGEQVNGWCYLDATTVPSIGDPALVPSGCTPDQRRIVRLVGAANPSPGSTMFIVCTDG